MKLYHSPNKVHIFGVRKFIIVFFGCTVL